MTDPYVYTRYGRRPITMFGLAASTAFIFGGWAYGAPWFVLAPAIIGALLALVPIIGNPVYEMRIDQQAMEINDNGKIRRILLSAIDYVKFTEWSDSSDVVVYLKDGTSDQIPAMTQPPTPAFRNIMSERGLVVKAD